MATISNEIEFILGEISRKELVLSHAGIAFVETCLPDIVLDMTM